jgi:uncharacterized protein YkwD
MVPLLILLSLIGQSADMARLQNAQRATWHLQALVPDLRLDRAAQVHAEDCARREALSHIGSDRSTYDQRIRREGVRFSSGSENVAAGWPDTPPWWDGDEFDASKAVNGWMGSKVGHRQNVLGRWSHFGNGSATARNGKRYYVSVYAMER